jgi:type II secretory pathway component GspD/PulD (secretin)
MLEEMISEWYVASIIIDPHVEFISLRHARASQAAARLAEFLKTEEGFEGVTVAADMRTNRLTIVGADCERMRAIKRYAAELDTP